MAGKKKRSSTTVGGDLVPARGSRGRTRDAALFPVPPSHVGMPSDSIATLDEIKERIRSDACALPCPRTQQ